MNNVLYQVGNGLYINLTNRCSCACTFCIRQSYKGLGSADTLWLERDPEGGEVIGLLEAEDLSRYSEVVFCGYGEPTERLDVLLEVCRYLRQASDIPIRINTNGLSDLINKRHTPPLFEGLMDTVSVSLNAPDEERYLEVTRPCFGKESFQAMLDFARECKEYVPHVVLSVVDVLSPEDIERSRELAQSLGLSLRVRVKS